MNLTDELMRIRGFGVNGGLTAENLRVAEDFFAKWANHACVPLEAWIDFRFQEQAIKSLGHFTS
jgi:hypothetical protein